MRKGPAELNDPARLGALQRTDLLDQPAEASFDRLVRLAAKVLDAPVALVSLVDQDRQFFAGCVGLPEPWASWRQTPLTHSFCQHVVTSGKALLIEDARRHPLVKENAAIDDLNVVAYAGVPLHDSQGALLGSFCVIDSVPRQWTPEQVDLLRNISESVVSEIELRLSLRKAKAREREVEEERRLKTAVLESTSEGIYGIDQDVRCTFVNPAAAQMLGYDAEELLGRNMHRLIHSRRPDGSGYPEEECPIAAVARNGISHRLAEDVLWRKDGTWFYAEYAASPIVEDGVIKGSVVTFRDITERKQAETALAESQQRLQMLFENAQDAILLADDNARYVDANPAASDLTGYSREELLQRHVWDLTPLPDREAAERLWREFISTERQGGEYTTARKDGSTVAVEYRAVANILPGLHLSVLRDVTERRRAEAALQEEQALHAASLQAALDCVVSMDHEGTVIEWNPAAEQTFGYTRDEAIGNKMADLIIPPAMRKAHGSGLAHYLASGEPQVLGRRLEMRAIRRDGEEFPVELAVARLPTSGSPRFTAYLRDISERQAAEAGLRQAKEEAERASTAKSEFIATLSHELRTPLTPVLLTASLLESDPQLAPHLLDDVRALRRNVQLEARIIDDLLDLTRITRGKLQLNYEVTDVHLILQSAFDICCRNDGVRTDLELGAERHFVRGDPARLQQVFWNLLNNAHKFTPAGGNITVRTGNPEAGRIRIDVIDTGAGIEPEVLPKLFAAFEQGETRGAGQNGGLGLGLAISRSLVKSHRGTLTAHSEGQGHGATFTVELATVAAPSPAPPKAGGPQPAETPQRALRILLVEDHEATLAALTKLLTKAGHVVQSAASVATGLVAADEQEFDLVISDVGLPDGSGNDLMRALRERHGLEGIALTGYGTDQDVRRSEDAGFTEHLTKPVDLPALEAAIARVAGRAGTQVARE